MFEGGDFHNSHLNKPQQAQIRDFAGSEIYKQLQEKFKDINNPFHFFALIEIKPDGKFTCNLIIPAPQNLNFFLETEALNEDRWAWHTMGQAITEHTPGTAVIKANGQIITQKTEARHSMIAAYIPGFPKRLASKIIWHNNPLGSDFVAPLEEAISNEIQDKGITAITTLSALVNTQKGLVNCSVRQGNINQKIGKGASGQDSPPSKVVKLQASQPQPEKVASANLPKVSTQLASLVASVVQNFERE